MSALARLRKICEKAEKARDVLRLTPPEVLTLIDALEECREALEYYSDHENVGAAWMEPDSYVPYWTLWDNEECVGGEVASKTLKKIEEKLKGLG